MHLIKYSILLAFYAAAAVQAIPISHSNGVIARAPQSEAILIEDIILQIKESLERSGNLSAQFIGDEISQLKKSLEDAGKAVKRGLFPN